MGQLGVLEYQVDSATQFGIQAKCRFESMKAFVKQDCSQGYMKAMLRNSGPIAKSYAHGDLIMYRKEQGEGWFGPARILGLEGKVAWSLHAGTSVASSVLRMSQVSTKRRL